MSKPHLDWAIQQLNHSDYQLETNNADIIQTTPWSTVYRFKTNHGFIFLKKVPPALALEPTVINFLHEKFQAAVPQVIAINHEQNCFLMQDAGMQLHDFFKENFNNEIFIRTIQNYADLQIQTSNKVNEFLNLGVPDWRLAKLPTLYHDLIQHETLLIADGLTQKDLISLKTLEQKFQAICEKLSNYKIKETFAHADFHDKNILINTNNFATTLIDLGEVVVTHPFFSLLNCLHRAKENFSLNNSHYQELISECLKPWLAVETHEHLYEILTLIQQCWPIHAVLGEFRLMTSVDPAAFKKLNRQERLAKNLRYWINYNFL